jgi:SagB-type dehydrogenase family enzyme
MFRDSYPLAWSFHGNTAGVHAVPQADDRVHPQEPHKEYPGAALVALPPPQFPTVALEQAVRERFSCRRFSDSPLELVDLATLLYSAYGIRSSRQVAGFEVLDRLVPSAGGLYPLEPYVLAAGVESQPAGIYHYNPLLHALERLSATLPGRSVVTALFMDQPQAGQASAVIVLTAVVERSLRKYGDRGYRYLLVEAGHLAQNLNLTAAALGVGACNLGAFADHDLAALLALDTDVEIPLYAVAVGNPAREPL